MKETREEKKAHMMARLEKAVDELLDWEAQHPRPTLRQLEDIIIELRKQVGKEMADEVLVGMEERNPVPGLACPKCGKEMRYKGQHEKQEESRAGEMEYDCFSTKLVFLLPLAFAIFGFFQRLTFVNLL